MGRSNPNGASVALLLLLGPRLLGLGGPQITVCLRCTSWQQQIQICYKIFQSIKLINNNTRTSRTH
jgi:hypothetical protein